MEVSFCVHGRPTILRQKVTLALGELLFMKPRKSNASTDGKTEGISDFFITNEKTELKQLD